MANPVADRASRTSSAEQIEADLIEVWQDVARKGPVSRAVMSNLVVFRRPEAGARVDLASLSEDMSIEEVARQHPARVIVLSYDPDAAQAQAAPEAQVGVLIFGPKQARYGVEQIVIRSACAEAALTSIVRPLMVGDVPTSVWWTEDFSWTPPLAPLVTMGRQLLYDSRRWRDIPAAVRALLPLLADRFGPDLADVNWRRLTPVRQAIVYAIASSGEPGRGTLTSIQIRHRAGEAALAWLLAGWLLARGALVPDPELTVQEEAQLDDDDVLTASLGDDLQVRLSGRRVCIADARGPAPFTVGIPQESEAQAVAAELRLLAHDAAFHDVLTALARHFGGA